MKINVYYGGRGLIGDPTLSVLNKIEEVLKELRVDIERINLYEQKNVITTLPQTLKDVDGIILASTVEWFGIGGYMQEFLDSCWLYGNKEKIKQLYMMPVVMSTAYGEKEAKLALTNAWEILGGLSCTGLCGYVDLLAEFELNRDYTTLIEKKAENLYRTISQKIVSLPTSNQAVKQSVNRTKQIQLTPQESEQLSEYVSNDAYVKKQKEDIQELSGIFKTMLEGQKKEEEPDTEGDIINLLKEKYRQRLDYSYSYDMEIDGKKEHLIIETNHGDLNCFYGKKENADVSIKVSKASLDSITAGRMTFQRAFMTGDITMKGDFTILNLLDQMFLF